MGAVRETPWSGKVRPAFRNTRRTLFRRRSVVTAPALISPLQKARILAEALPFIRAFHASTLIIRFGGGAMADPALKEGFARDVALLRLVGMNPIIVHGGGWRIDDLLADDGHRESPRASGVRVTDEATLNVVEMVLGEINQELVGLINKFGAKAVGLSGQDGRFIHARRMTLPPDRRAACRPTSASSARSRASIPNVIHLLLSRGFIPVIMPIGVGVDGTAYHINSDAFAGAARADAARRKADPDDQRARASTTATAGSRSC